MLPYEIDATQLARLLQEKAKPGDGTPPTSFVLLDVREPWEFALAHVDGSLFIPMGEIPSRAFQELDPETHIVTMCHAGVRSMNVAVWLRNQGFEQTQSLQGGIDAWSTLVDPKVPRY